MPSSNFHSPDHSFQPLFILVSGASVTTFAGALARSSLSKSFPGRASEWEQRALSYAPQLMTYAAAIEMAGGTVIGRFVPTGRLQLFYGGERVADVAFDPVPADLLVL